MSSGKGVKRQGYGVDHLPPSQRRGCLWLELNLYTPYLPTRLACYGRDFTKNETHWLKIVYIHFINIYSLY